MLTASAAAALGANQFDILIAGGGMVGATLAYALLTRPEASQRPLKVAVIEAVPPQAQHQPSFDARSIALSRSSVEIFNKLELWSRLLPYAEPIQHIHVSDRGHLGMSRIHADDHRLSALGYVVEVQDVAQVLWQALDETEVTWFTPASIGSLQQQRDWVKIHLSSGEQLQTRLLIAADGARSETRSLLKIDTREQVYQQSALIANVRTDTPHQNWAFERFTDTGPLALLPMSDNRYSLVWSVAPEQAQELLNLPEQAFLQRLQQRFGYRSGVFIQAGERHVYPLKLVRAERLISHRAAILGNAAHTLHPIAGQGFNLGLRDIWQLVKQIFSDPSQDPGAFKVLDAYQQAQQQDHDKVIGMTDTLCRVFSNQYPPLVAGRNLGLVASQLMPPLNDWVARQGMGRMIAP